MKTDLKAQFERCRERLNELSREQKELDAKREDGLSFAEQAEISAARADLFLEFAKIHIELAALSRSFAEILLMAEPQATPQPSTPLHS